VHTRRKVRILNSSLPKARASAADRSAKNDRRWPTRLNSESTLELASPLRLALGGVGIVTFDFNSSVSSVISVVNVSQPGYQSFPALLIFLALPHAAALHLE